MVSNELISTSVFDQWLQNHFNQEQIVSELQSKGLLQNQIDTVLQQYKKHKLLIRTNKGFLFMGIGAVLGLVSCLMTVYEIMPAFRDFILYGLTSLGIGLAMYGGYLVFE